MISNRGREIRKTRLTKMSKKMERLYKDGKCRDCTVVVTRMNFAKILGKFTKVKIQYESDVPSKTKPTTTVKSSNSNTRLKNNENGMVLIHKNTYEERPKKDNSTKKPKIIESTKILPTKVLGNVMKENRLKRTLDLDDTLQIYKKTRSTNLKKYEIGFQNPKVENKDSDMCSISLKEILHNVDKRILPSDDWCIEYLPKCDEPQHDKVYDRIAAELEGLMNNEKPSHKPQEKLQVTNNNDNFPSIMDILNENTESSVKTKDNLESSDVEAMLLGKSNAVNKKEIVHVNIDNDMKKLLEDVEKLDPLLEAKNANDKLQETNELQLDRPLHSPSILDEALQKGIEEHLPVDTTQSSNMVSESDTVELRKEEETSTDIVNGCLTDDTNESIDQKAKSKSPEEIDKNELIDNVSHVVFSKMQNGKCYKTVTCPQDMKYKVELEGKIIQLLGAPKYIESVEDLQILLQIVDECDLKSMYLLD